tara:strand:- start:2362 stop:2718 length:357 start_codon:yes stop_codon:yes gene_type:complete
MPDARHGRAAADIAVRRRRHGNNPSSGDSAVRIPHDLLHRQYLADIACAHGNGFIDKANAHPVIDWVNGWHVYRSSLQALRKGWFAHSITAGLEFACAPLSHKLRVICDIARRDYWKV